MKRQCPTFQVPCSQAFALAVPCAPGFLENKMSLISYYHHLSALCFLFMQEGDYNYCLHAFILSHQPSTAILCHQEPGLARSKDFPTHSLTLSKSWLATCGKGGCAYVDFSISGTVAHLLLKLPLPLFFWLPRTLFSHLWILPLFQC
jgi:hypothetical protein